MGRPVPLWFFLFCLLCGLLLAVDFGWAIRSKLIGNNAAGKLGDAAVAVASFPELTKEVLHSLYEQATGDYQDELIRTRRGGVDYSGFKPIATALGISLPGVLVKADGNGPRPGWRMLTGAFSLNGEIDNAILLISPKLEVVRAVRLSEVKVGEHDPQLKYRKIVHGVEVFRDGSTIFAFDGGASLQRFDTCGNRTWAIPGFFNHSVTMDDAAQSVWTIKGAGPDTAIDRISVGDGNTVQDIKVQDIIDANPDIDILQLRFYRHNDLGTNKRTTDGFWFKQAFHLNDVDPLPAAIADRFPKFDAGDLLVSSRALNLLFVLDPRTLHVKWWRVGATEHQHDPDWDASGQISVLDNRMGRGFSEIKEIDPENFQIRTLLDGRKYDFYTRIRGKHQVFEDGGMVITSPQQGRAFEVDRNGKNTFDIVNLKPSDHAMTYAISELRWLPPDYFSQEAWQCPSAD